MLDMNRVFLNQVSIRKYQDKSIPEEVIGYLKDAARQSPSGGNLQDWCAIQVNDKEVREKLCIISGKQSAVREAPLVFVFCADLARLSRHLDGEEGAPMETYSETNMLLGSVVDASLAAMRLYLAAQYHGLGGVIISGIIGKPVRLGALLKLPKLVYPLFAVCLGYPAEEPMPRPRLCREIMFMQDTYGTPDEEALLAAYDKETREYYRARSGGEKDISWKENSIGFMKWLPHKITKEFLNAQDLMLE